MKNYQKLHYEEYYIMLPDGSSIKTTRAECFATDETSNIGPFKQRWYYSPDQFMAIRLPRNEEGDRLGKDNAADLKAQERVVERIRERGVIAIDAPVGDNGASFDIPDLSVNIEEECIDEETTHIILAAVDRLPAELKDLWEALLAGEKQCNIAARCGVSATAIRKRTEKLARILGADPSLKNLF